MNISNDIFIILEKADDLAWRWDFPHEYGNARGSLVWSSTSGMWRIIDQHQMPGKGDVIVLDQEHPDTPAVLTAVSESNVEAIHVLCHYGNDLSAIDVESRWRQLAQNIKVDSKTIDNLRLMNGGLPPVPFSHGQHVWSIAFPHEQDLSKLSADFQRSSRRLTLGWAAEALTRSTPFMCCLTSENFAERSDEYGATELIELAFQALPKNLNLHLSTNDLLHWSDVERDLIIKSREWWDVLFELGDKLKSGKGMPSEDLATALKCAIEYSTAVTHWIQWNGNGR